MNLNNVTYFIQDLENMGKKRIEFSIHKSWQTEKGIAVYKSQSGLTALRSFITFFNKQTVMYLNKCHVKEARECVAQTFMSWT